VGGGGGVGPVFSFNCQQPCSKILLIICILHRICGVKLKLLLTNLLQPNPPSPFQHLMLPQMNEQCMRSARWQHRGHKLATNLREGCRVRDGRVGVLPLVLHHGVQGGTLRQKGAAGGLLGGAPDGRPVYPRSLCSTKEAW